MITAATTRDHQKGKGLGIFLGFLFLITAAPTSAQANTYLFSFTGQDISDALLAAHKDESGTFTGTTLWRRSAVFGLWLEPDQGTVTNYSYVNSSSPNPLATYPWESNIISDPADLPSSRSYVGYRTIHGSSDVTVMSGYNGGPGGTNIFVGATFDDNDNTPLGWGPTTATIRSIMSPGSVFQFTLKTLDVLPGNVMLNGQASELRSSSTSSFVEDKTYSMQFSLQATVTETVPEPGTIVLFAGGGLMLCVGWVLKKRKHSDSKYELTRE